MASRFDLEPRIAALHELGLTVTSDYNGNPPRWLMAALKDCDMRVINIKGLKADDSVCMVRLAFLESLLTKVEETLSPHESEVTP